MVVVQLSAAMSILNYFKPQDGLPDPKGPLSQSLSSRAITAANSEVANVIGGSASHLHALKTANRLSIPFAANDQ